MDRDSGGRNREREGVSSAQGLLGALCLQSLCWAGQMVSLDGRDTDPVQTESVLGRGRRGLLSAGGGLINHSEATGWPLGRWDTAKRRGQFFCLEAWVLSAAPPKEHEGQNWRVGEPPDRPQRQPSPARPPSEQTEHTTMVEVWKCPVPGLPGWPADAPREAGSADQLGGRARP